MTSLYDCIKNDDDCNNSRYYKRYYKPVFEKLFKEISIICCISCKGNSKIPSDGCNYYLNYLNNNCKNSFSADIYIITSKENIIVIECHFLDTNIINSINNYLKLNRKKYMSGAIGISKEKILEIITKISSKNDKISNFLNVINCLRGKYKNVFPIFLTNSKFLKNLYLEYIEIE
ncbi:MAG: hypothetical protein LRS47_03380 [Desulfurococcales archaeon]|nr:hypothetical protein [Desulfurococcales archaeon]